MPRPPLDIAAADASAAGVLRQLLTAGEIAEMVALGEKMQAEEDGSAAASATVAQSGASADGGADAAVGGSGADDGAAGAGDEGGEGAGDDGADHPEDEASSGDSDDIEDVAVPDRKQSECRDAKP